MTGRIWTSSKQSHESRTKRKDELLGWNGQMDEKYTKPKDSQQIVQVQLLELIAVFVQHSYEKVSVVKFGCLVKRFFCVCSLP